MTYTSTLNFYCPHIHNLPIFDIYLIIRMFTKLEALEQFHWAVLSEIGIIKPGMVVTFATNQLCTEVKSMENV